MTSLVAFSVDQSSVEISMSPPGRVPPMSLRFIDPGLELRRALKLMCEFKDPSIPLDRRRALNAEGARAFRLAIKGHAGQTAEYFVHAPTGVAAPLLVALEDVPFGLTPVR